MKILSILVCLLVVEFAYAAHLHIEAVVTPAAIPPIPASIEPIPADAPEPITAPTPVISTPAASVPIVEESKKDEKEEQPEVENVVKPKAPAKHVNGNEKSSKVEEQKEDDKAEEKLEENGER